MKSMKKILLPIFILCLGILFSATVNASTIQYVDFGTMPNGDYIIGVNNSMEFSSRTVNGDLYVRRGAEFTFYGNMTVYGDVYILGDFFNQGVMNVMGTVHVLNYYENNQLIMQALREVDGIPCGFAHGNLYNNGTINYNNLCADSEIAFMDIPLVPIEVKTECEKGNHEPGEWQEETKPTCNKSGLEIKRCTVCNEQLESRSIPETGHTPGKWNVIKKATSTEKGIQTQKCTKCGKKLKTKNIPKTYVKLNASSLVLQLNKTTSALKVSQITSGNKVQKWTSSNSKIVSVNKTTGKLTAKKVGKAKITVTTNTGAKATCTVTVQKAAVKTKSISLSKKTVTLNVGCSYKISVTLKPIASSEKITFKSSKPSVATVNSSGKIVAKKKGKTTITIKSGKALAKITVNVKDSDVVFMDY